MGTQEGAKGCRAFDRVLPNLARHGSALPRRVPLGATRAQFQPEHAVRRIHHRPSIIVVINPGGSVIG